MEPTVLAPGRLKRNYIRIQSKSAATIEINLENSLILGRELFSHYKIFDALASLRHAIIEARGTIYFLRDLKSPQGTYVNGVRVGEVQLRHLDRIRLGLTEVIFCQETENEYTDLTATSLNPAWSEQLSRLPSLAQAPHPVLILGPSGTGKEGLAQQIHRLSRRCLGPFVSVNCSALSENLTESELFGHIKGSFTGASENRIGAFEAARGGTLFLDEIADLPMSLQPKLLRALENNEIKPVGSDELRSTDVRIVAATNHNLNEMIRHRRFRHDLYFRLHILQIQPPPLTERMEDFDRILQFYAKPSKVRFTVEALQYLKMHNWPGNIRELKNAVSRASALYPDQPITPKEVATLIDRSGPLINEPESPRVALYRQFRNQEREVIIEKLLVHQGNQRQAAIDLGMPRSTLNDRIHRYGINIREILNLSPDSLDDHEVPEDETI